MSKLMVYTLTREMEKYPINEEVELIPLRWPGDMEASTSGFMNVDSHHYCIVMNGCYFLKVGFYKKQVSKSRLDKMIDDWRKEVGKVSKFAIRKQKEIFTEQLLPTADVKLQSALVMINPISMTVNIGTATSSLAESVLAVVRKYLGSLPVVPLSQHYDSHMLYHTLFENEDVELGDRCKVITSDDEKVTIQDSSDLYESVMGVSNVSRVAEISVNHNGNYFHFNEYLDLKNGIADGLNDLEDSPQELLPCFEMLHLSNCYMIMLQSLRDHQSSL